MDTLLAIGRRALRGRPAVSGRQGTHPSPADGRGPDPPAGCARALRLLRPARRRALILTFASSGQAALLLVVLGLVAFVFLRSLGFMRLDRVTATAADRKRNRALRAAVRPIGRRLQQLRRIEEISPIIVEAAGVFGATEMSLRVGDRSVAHTRTDDEPHTERTRTFRSQFLVPGGKGPNACWTSNGRTDAPSSIATPRSRSTFSASTSRMPGRAPGRSRPARALGPRT